MLRISINVYSPNILTAEPFVTNLSIVWHFHELECHARRFVCCLQGLPKGCRGCQMSPSSGISGLSFDSTLLSILLFFCLTLLLFLSYIFFCLLVHSPELFPENYSIFLVKKQAFLYGSCLAARRSKLVSGMCSMLPCCHMALVFNVMILYTIFLFYCFCPFLFLNTF